MVLMWTFLAAFGLLASAHAQTVTTTTSSTKPLPSPTLVWVTPPGMAPYQSVYHQGFATFWSIISTPETGTIGLGGLSGTIGGTREYPIVPENNAASVLSSAAEAVSTLTLSLPEIPTSANNGRLITHQGTLLNPGASVTPPPPLPNAAASPVSPAVASPVASPVSPAEASPAVASPVSPAVASPAEASPAVASPAEASPAVASPAVASPAVASPAEASPAVASPVASPAEASPAVASPAAEASPVAPAVPAAAPP